MRLATRSCGTVSQRGHTALCCFRRGGVPVSLRVTFRGFVAGPLLVVTSPRFARLLPGRRRICHWAAAATVFDAEYRPVCLRDRIQSQPSYFERSEERRVGKERRSRGAAE